MARKRELIEPNEGDKRYVRRDAQGKFNESDDVGRSLSQDKKRSARTTSKPGEGDRGDRASSARGRGSSSGSSGNRGSRSR